MCWWKKHLAQGQGMLWVQLYHIHVKSQIFLYMERFESRSKMKTIGPKHYDGLWFVYRMISLRISSRSCPHNFIFPYRKEGTPHKPWLFNASRFSSTVTFQSSFCSWICASFQHKRRSRFGGVTDNGMPPRAGIGAPTSAAAKPLAPLRAAYSWCEPHSP